MNNKNLKHISIDPEIESLIDIPISVLDKAMNESVREALKRNTNKSTPAKEKESAQPNHKDGPIYSDDPSVQFLLETIMGKRR